MGAAVQLQIVTTTGTFVFDVQPGYFPRTEAEWKEASNPPEVVALRETWEFRQAKFVSGDATVASTWTKWLAFKAAIAPSGTARARATSARLVRDPAGAAATLLTIGGTGWEGFRVEALEGETDEQEPAASWRTVAACTLRVSAVAKHADANGIVGWEQQTDLRYENGLQVVELRTRITTAEGTSAVTKAQSYAALTASAFGSTFLYETNGPHGVDVTIVDDDRPNSRTPTIVDAVSRIRGYGISFGTVTPGNAPSSVTYSVTTKTTAKETTTVTEASAAGPGAETFVRGQAPAVYSESEIFVEPSGLNARGVWTNSSKAADAKRELLVRATISGGRAFGFEPGMTGAAVLFAGGFGAYTAVVEVERSAVGADGLLATLTLPGPPGNGWTFDPIESQEGEPFLAEAGISTSQDRWERSARLVFRAGALPRKPILELMAEADEVRSYLYGAS